MDKVQIGTKHGLSMVAVEVTNHPTQMVARYQYEGQEFATIEKVAAFVEEKVPDEFSFAD